MSGHPRAVAAVRSLARAGVPVVGVRSEACLQDCYSRYLRERFVVNPTPAELLPFLDALGRDGGGMLFAIDDDYLILAAKHFDDLSRRFTLTMPRWETLRRVMDHACLYEIGQELGLNTPRIYRPRDETDLRRFVAGLDLVNREYLLKTIPGTVPAELSNGRCTKVAGSDSEKIRANCLEIFSRLGEFPMIAEVVPGEADQCIGVTMVVGRDHTPVFAYATKRLKLQTYSRGGFVHPYELGSNVYCESVRDEEAVDASTRLVRAAGYHGVITFEFRRDSRDQKLILVKADPRFVRPTSLSTALGLDTPSALYRLFVDGRIDCARTWPEGVGWLWPTMYLESLWNNRADRPVRQDLIALARRIRRIRAFGQLDLRDPMPCLMHVQWRGRVWTAARLHGIARRYARAFGRWDTHHQAASSKGR